jgi:anti-sigma-K factor RskA
MTDDPDIDGLAAEYVLGSLSRAERSAVELRCKRDPTLSQAVRAWESRLGALNELVPEVAPPPELFATIMRRVGRVSQLREPSAEVVTLRRSAQRWRALATSVGALAACLALVVAWFLYSWNAAPTTFVADLHRASGSTTADEITRPAFLVTVDATSCEIMVRPVTARPRPGRSYMLWLLQPGAKEATSLGVIGPAETKLPCPAEHRARQFQNAMLAVSLELEGASATQAPTSDYMFVGKLIAEQAPGARMRP